MDPRTALKLVGRLDDLDHRATQVRLGVITDTDPLSVALGGSDTPYTTVKQIDAAPLAIDDVVAVLRFGRDLLILGRLSSGADPWHSLTLQNSWADFGSVYAPAGYRKASSGQVRLRGVIKDGTFTAGTTVATLPVGYRPPYPVIGTAYHDDSEFTWWWEVGTGGALTLIRTLPGNSFMSLDQVMFDVT